MVTGNVLAAADDGIFIGNVNADGSTVWARQTSGLPSSRSGDPSTTDGSQMGRFCESSSNRNPPMALSVVNQ